jgi:hypothetical protein
MNLDEKQNNKNFHRYFSQKDLLVRVPKCFLILASVYFVTQVMGFFMMFEKDENPENEQLIENNVNSDELDINEESLKLNEEVNSIGVRYKNINEGMSIKEAIRQKPFYLLASIICLFNLGPQLMTGNYKVSLNRLFFLLLDRYKYLI